MGQNYKSLNYIQFIVNKKNGERYIKNGGAYMNGVQNLKTSDNKNKK